MNLYILLLLIICFLFIFYYVIQYRNKTLDYNFFENSPSSDGAKGEMFLFNSINSIPIFKYGVPNLIVISPDKYNSVETDIVFLFPSGLYVIESKNKYGQVSGDLSNKNDWIIETEHDYTSMFSPVNQNDGHIYALKQYFELDDIPIHNVVAFGPKCILKISGKRSRPDVKVMHYKGVKKYIIRQELKSLITKKRLPKDRIVELGETILNTKLGNQKYKDIHVENTKRHVNEKNNTQYQQQAQYQSYKEPTSDDLGIDQNKINYIKELLNAGMKAEDVAAINFVDISVVEKIKQSLKCQKSSSVNNTIINNFCPNCGSKLFGESNFCGKCGTKIK